MDEFADYFSTLPENQRDSTNYKVRRYWELHGKPKNFEEAKQKGMFTLLSDGYHANSIAYNKDEDKYEFMKSANHPTLWMEFISYYLDPSKDMEQFRQTYHPIKNENGEFEYVKYKQGNKINYLKFY